MTSKATRILVAAIALVSLAGMTAAPADASAPKQTRNVWCC